MTKEVVPLKVIMVNVPGDAHRGLPGPGRVLRGEDHPALAHRHPLPEGRERRRGGRLVSQRARQGSHAAARAHPFLQLPGDRSARGDGQGGAGVPASAVGGVVRLAPHHRSSGTRTATAGWSRSSPSPPRYTKPPWATYDRYPFLEPGVDFASTFILERPSDDWLREVPALLRVSGRRARRGRRSCRRSGDSAGMAACLPARAAATSSTGPAAR